MKNKIIRAGLQCLQATRLHRRLSAVTRGCGAILMFHNVRPDEGWAYAPNQALEITPEFLETTVQTLRDLEYDIVPIAEAPGRLARKDGRQFAVLTFDDGYRDNLEIAAPILRRYGAPYTIYVTTGFAERTARLWWLELEAAIRALDEVNMTIGGRSFSAPARTVWEKSRAYSRAFAFLGRHDEPAMLDAISALVRQAGSRSDFTDLCMTWDEIRAASEDPLCTIGVHTLTHARLTKHADSVVRRELESSRKIIEERIGRPAEHLAYPFGNAHSAGPREFEIARECGFRTAVTTRPGVVFPEHVQHLTALPRVSVQGTLQERGLLETLLSGAPLAFWNFGRRVNVG